NFPDHAAGPQLRHDDQFPVFAGEYRLELAFDHEVHRVALIAESEQLLSRPDRVPFTRLLQGGKTLRRETVERGSRGDVRLHGFHQRVAASSLVRSSPAAASIAAIARPTPSSCSSF